MHINYRRKNKRRARRKKYGGYLLAYSLRWWKREANRDRRADERRLIHHGRWDELPTHYPRDIYWKYW